VCGAEVVRDTVVGFVRGAVEERDSFLLVIMLVCLAKDLSIGAATLYQLPALAEEDDLDRSTKVLLFRLLVAVAIASKDALAEVAAFADKLTRLYFVGAPVA